MLLIHQLDYMAIILKAIKNFHIWPLPRLAVACSQAAWPPCHGGLCYARCGGRQKIERRLRESSDVIFYHILTQIRIQIWIFSNHQRFQFAFWCLLQFLKMYIISLCQGSNYLKIVQQRNASSRNFFLVNKMISIMLVFIKFRMLWFDI